MENPLDVNQASLEELLTLPGITPELAERLIAARPFQAPEDLRRVKGMNSRLVKRLTPHLVFPESAPASQSPEEVSATAAVEIENPTEETPPPGELPPPPTPPVEEPSAETPEAAAEKVTPPPLPTPEPPAPAGKPLEPPSGGSRLFSRSETLLYAGLFSLLSLILAFLFTLGFLAVLNGGLRYVTPARFTALQSRVETLKGEITALQQDVEALRLRVETMEALSGRVSTLENETSALRTDLETATAQVNQLKNQIDDLNQQVHTVQKSVQAFERFLQGLRTLLVDLTPSSP